LEEFFKEFVEFLNGQDEDWREGRELVVLNLVLGGLKERIF